MRLSAIAILFVIILLCIGCSSNVPIPESNVSLLRVQLAELQISEPSTDHNAERTKYIEISRRAENIQAYNISATAYTLLANYYENQSYRNTDDTKTEFLNNALKYYQKALYFDKKEQNLLASASNPFPNADKIAISLNNISFIYEKLGSVDNAIKYADRAFNINRNLELINRVIKDCERLSGLYKRIGNKKMTAEFEQIQKEYEIKHEKQKLIEESSKSE